MIGARCNEYNHHHRVICHCTGEGTSSFNRPQYDLNYSQLYARELPYFTTANACGNCGVNPTDLTDAAWFDFLSYLQFKALSKQLPASRM